MPPRSPVKLPRCQGVTRGFAAARGLTRFPRNILPVHGASAGLWTPPPPPDTRDAVRWPEATATPTVLSRSTAETGRPPRLARTRRTRKPSIGNTVRMYRSRVKRRRPRSVSSARMASPNWPRSEIRGTPKFSGGRVQGARSASRPRNPDRPWSARRPRRSACQTPAVVARIPDAERHDIFGSGLAPPIMVRRRPLGKGCGHWRSWRGPPPPRANA